MSGSRSLAGWSRRVFVAVALVLGVVSDPVAAELTEVTELQAADPGASDSFGHAVGLDGDVVVVGSPLDDTPAGFLTGSVYVFERGSGGDDAWEQVAKLVAPDAAFADELGTSVAVSGATLVSGAVFDDDAGEASGSAYVFERGAGKTNWEFAVKLVASDAAEGDELGRAVAIWGDTVAAGLPRDDDRGEDSGSVLLFERDAGGPGAWGEVAKVTASDGVAGDLFGWSVSLSGSILLVGAYEHGGSGSAYLFERDAGGEGAWGEVAELVASDGAAGDWFGWSVAISGDTGVVGSRFHEGTGAAYVYRQAAGGPGAWAEVAELVASDAEINDAFGHGVAVSGDDVLVGNYLDDDQGDASGSAYLFQRNVGGPEAWGEAAKILASDGVGASSFGWSVAISGSTALVGADETDDPFPGAGSAYVFRADVSGSVTGVDGRDAACANRATGQTVVAPLDPAGLWDCEAAGLDAQEGDPVVVRITGIAESTPVGGTVDRLATLGVACSNRTTGQRERLRLDGATSWDCTAAGLVTSPGDRVVQSIAGRVE